ncbi:MAG: hypothetical protein DBX93_02745 [Oscillospiraceae bacterium]|nr:MAG: hypothetical protein DBX93_02745 [Oscillospiraceae bacterium]
MIIMVELPEKNVSRISSGRKSFGICTPVSEEIQSALLTPGTSWICRHSELVYSGGMSSTISMVVAALWKGSSNSFSPFEESKSGGR